MLWFIAAAVALAATFWGPIVSNVEQPNYTVVESAETVEIRDYPSMILAETTVSGERSQAINEGFRVIADYIFGNNVSSEKVAMTAPVTQQEMGNSWQVRFIMPAGYSLQSLPKPRNDAVKLVEITGKRFAVIRFSGMAGEDSLKVHTEQLTQYLTAKHLIAASPPTYAFYNPPWTLPFMRRNEVMIELVR